MQNKSKQMKANIEMTVRYRGLGIENAKIDLEVSQNPTKYIFVLACLSQALDSKFFFSIYSTQVLFLSDSLESSS